MSARLLGALALALLCLHLSPSSATAETDPFGEVTPVMVVIDTSGSMDQVDGDNERRIDVARSAMLGLVHDLGDTSTYGMLSYPGGTKDQGSGCASGQVRTRLGPLSSAQASSDIRRLSPDGGTPTGPALLRAKKLLEDAGYQRGTVVLVSDGESNCGIAPCEAAQQIVDSGFDMRVYPVGFHIPGEADELECVARTTGGTYVDAGNQADLDEAIGNAVPATLELDVQAPAKLGIRTGTYESGVNTRFTATVRSVGRLPAHDVRLTLSLVDSVGKPILVGRPIRSLGNLATGDSHQVTFDVRPEGTIVHANWQVTATAVNAARREQSGRLETDDGLGLADAGPLLKNVDHVVVVGDSYSSGEGSGVYLADSPGACHRSARAYAGWLFEDKAEQLACSGAVTADFRGSDESGGVYLPPQSKALRQRMLADDPPQAVFMSIGGNDAKFGAIAAGCITSTGHKCKRPFPFLGGESSDEEKLRKLGEGIRNDVRDVIADVDAAANDSKAQAKRGGGEIPIIVVPYVRILPETGAGADGCQIGVSADELDMLNGFLDSINGSVKAATDSLRSQGRPVYYASYVIDAFQPNHTICEGVNRSYANMDNFQAAQQQYLYLSDQEVLHPNSPGYQAEARAIIAWTHSAEAKPVTARGSVTFKEFPEVKKYDPFDPDPGAQPCLPMLCMTTPGTSVPVQGSGFAPKSDVVVRLHSVPHTLGAIAADDGGNVDAEVLVPADTSAGDHHLELLGSAPDGSVHVTSTRLRVWPRGSRWWAAGGVVGLALVAGAGAILWRRRTA